MSYYGMARWMGGMERRQGCLGRVVDIGAEMFAKSAVCVRAQMDASRGGDGGRETGGRGGAGIELADAFCAQARQRCEELFGQLWNNTDPAHARLARKGMSRRYTWLEYGIIDPSVPGPRGAP